MGFDSAWSWVASAVSDAGGAVGDAVDAGVEWVKDTAGDVSDAIGTGWDNVSNWYDSYVSPVGDAIGDAWATGNEWFESFVTEGSDFYQDAYDAAAEGIDDSAIGIQEYLDDAGESWGEYWDYAWDASNVPVDETTQQILDNLERDRNIVADTVDNIELALGVGFDFAMAALGSLPGLFTGFKDALGDWFHFDLDEFMSELSKAQGKTKEE